MGGVILEKKTAQRMARATLGWESQNSGSATQPTYGRFPGAHEVLQILLTDTVPAASYDKSTKKLKPIKFTAKIWYAHADDDDSLTYFDDITVTGLSYYVTAVSVSANKGRYAWLVNGRLLVTDCSEIDL